MTRRRNVTAALIYDFDGTLAPGNMQERQFIPDIGMSPAQFWEEVDDVVRDQQTDRILTYMYYMLRRAGEKNVPVRLSDFRELGQGVEFFPGVVEWFAVVNAQGRQLGLNVEHYIVSSGNGEIIDGTAIAPMIDRIYASRFLFDHNGVAVWPANAVNYTTKTQFLFRINKGAHDLSDDSGINRFVPKEERVVPFENMVYIGDGETDVPCFRLVKEEGGLSIAVYPPRSRTGLQRAEGFMRDGRVHGVAPADWRDGGRLHQLVSANLKFIADRDEYQRKFERAR